MQMNRREFSTLLPLLAAAATVAPAAESQAPVTPMQTPAQLPNLVSGRYQQTEPTNLQPTPRLSKRFLMGMLPDNIRLEAHFTHLAPGCPPEPIAARKFTEFFFIQEGTARLVTAGVTHDLAVGEMGIGVAGDPFTIYNASQTEPASYFAVTVGPPE
jgi:hypothetical protein